MSVHTRYVQLGTDWIPQYAAQSRGMGDLIAKGLHAFGVKQTPGCPCPRRQARWNRAVPFARHRSYMAPAIIRRRPPIMGGSGSADLFFNSTECPHVSGVPVDPDDLFCDDFDHGFWFNDFDDPDLNNRGWLAISNSGTPYSPGPGASSVQAGGVGGTGFASRADFDGGAVGSDANTAMHGFYPGNATYEEVYYRFYVNLSAGWDFNGQQKWITWNGGLHTGIDFGGGPTHDIENLTASPLVDASNDSYQNPLGTPPSFNYIRQNLGVDVTLTTAAWWYVEFHVKLNTFCATHPGTDPNAACRNGIWEVWANNCGALGIDCGPGTSNPAPTRRAFYPNVAWRGVMAGALGATPSGNIGTPWHDNWGNPSDGGIMLIDNVRARKSFIGFAGAEAPPPAIVSALSSRKVMRGYALVA